MSTKMIGNGTESVLSLLIFPLHEPWKQILLTHRCTFGMHEYGETIIFPEGTTRILLLNPRGLPTNRYRIVLPNSVELREALDDEGTGKSRLITLILEHVPMQTEGITEQSRKAARALIERAEARKDLITVLTRCLECSNNLLVKMEAAELRDDPNWFAFVEQISWY